MSTTETATQTEDSVLDTIRGTRSALSRKRVFGETYDVEDMTIIPVTRLAGGAGGGSGEESDEEHESQSRGFGSGFGLGASPVGVYEIHDGQVQWKPAIDVNRAIRGGQILAGIIAVCFTLVKLRRS